MIVQEVYRVCFQTLQDFPLVNYFWYILNFLTFFSLGGAIATGAPANPHFVQFVLCQSPHRKNNSVYNFLDVDIIEQLTRQFNCALILTAVLLFDTRSYWFVLQRVTGIQMK